MAFDAGAVVGKAIFDDTQWKKGVQGVDKSNSSMTKSFIKANLALGALKKGFNAAKQFIGDSVKAASDLQEANSKLLTVFSDVSKSAKNTTKELVSSYGLSTKAATELLGSTGDILTGFGVNQKAALELSGATQKLAVDLASFTNAQGGAKSVSDALTKAYTGERESLKTYGIVITEAEVQQRLLDEGKAKLTGNALRQAKAEVTLAIALEQSKNAVGDFARTQDSFANVQKRTQAGIEDIQTTIGTNFLPILTDLSTGFLDNVQSFRDWISTAEGAKVIAKIAVGIGAAFRVIFETIKGAVSVTVDFIKSLIESGKVVGALFTFLKDRNEETWGAFKEQTDEAGKSFKNLGSTVLDVGENIFGVVKEEVAAFDGKVLDLANRVIDAGGKIKDTFTEVAKTTKETFKEMAASINEGFNDSIKGIMDKFSFLLSGVQSTMNNIFDVVDLGLQNQLDAIDAETAEEIEKLTEKKEAELLLLEQTIASQQEQLLLDKENGIITQAEYDARYIALEEQRKTKEAAVSDKFNKLEDDKQKKALEKQNAIEKKQFEANKANTIADVWIEFALGTMAAWVGAFQALGGIPIVGPALAIAFAAVMTGTLLGTSIAQTVLVGQQQFVPKKERGGFARGLTEINENRRGELVNLPDGAVVIPNDISRQIAANVGGGMGGNNINVSFSGANISDNMSLRKVSNYVISDMAKKLRLNT